MRFFLVTLLAPFFMLVQASGQETPDSLRKKVLPALEVEGKLMPHVEMEEVYVVPYTRKEFRYPWQRWRYYRLIRNVKTVYPYAKLASKKFKEMNEHYQSLESERAKRKYMGQLEEELMDEFGEDLKHLTISQGRLLIKLVDRETGNTSYDILKEYKGSFSAVFWQALARLFGSNLKSEYDATGKDRLIEEIIFLYERGLL